MNIIQTIGLTKKFGDFVANDHIDLSIKEGEIRCIVGENGAGKSTLMNMLYGMLRPTSGTLLLRGKEVQIDSPTDAINLGLGMVHQHFKLVPSLTVYENILLGAEIKKSANSPLIDTRKEIEVVRTLIDDYDFELNPEDKVEDISVGERQRVEILKMLYRNVDILILDEPTAVLTPQEVDGLFENLRKLRSQGKTIIVITHKLREVMALSDNVTVIKAGKVVGQLKTSETNEVELAQLMVGRKVAHAVNDGSVQAPSDNIMYYVENLRTIDGYGNEVLFGVSFEVHKGEILGIAGVEGNGQSELVSLLSGTMEATAGKVFLKGNDITNWWPDQLRHVGIGIIPEDRGLEGLCGTMSIADNAIAGYHDRSEVCHHGFLDSRAIKTKRDRLLEAFAVRTGDVNGDVGALSGGNAQKLIVARELESNPHFLIACQPTRGVDIGSEEFIHAKLLDFRNAGQSVLLVSSELSEVLGLSDRVLVMYRGKIAGEVDPKKVTSREVGLLMAGISAEEQKSERREVGDEENQS
nr:ABC transporter ATP-binding protein [Olegusella massiliensis]